MEFLQRTIEWAGDQFNSNFVRTIGALVAIPGGLWGCYLFVRWLMGKGLDASVEQIRKQNEDLKRDIERLIIYVQARDGKDIAPSMVPKETPTPPQGLAPPQEHEEIRGKVVRYVRPKYGSRPQRQKVAYLSFAQADQQLVIEQEDLLSRHGIAAVHIDPGEQFQKNIERTIASADVFVLFWSKLASQSEWVAREIALALPRIESGHLQFFPIVLEDPAPPPPEMLKHIYFPRAAAAHPLHSAQR